ncbi:hypothetical protein HPB52_022848 [Rhipicephalus sanguineus]|uniref:Uncharacterized protein n=1 Tax=Rhipicephalus sanguineus TaxID=34632 RepID=A0A9D4TBX9_RHISA|nr:hypothetical protein HPB52_022848 [Rhipicephalus sanguineus]
MNVPPALIDEQDSTKLISEADSALEAQADEATLNVLSARLGALLTHLNEVDAAVEPLVPHEEAEENYARTIAYNDRMVTYVASSANKLELNERTPSQQRRRHGPLETGT